MNGLYTNYDSLSNIIISRIVAYYSTASTEDSVYIIGGWQDSSSSRTIAQFKDNEWVKIGDLNQGRRGHGSITVGLQTIIIGGKMSGSK